MKRSLFLKVGAVVLALTALLLVLPNTAQVSDPFVAQVDAAAAARFVNLHPEQYANFFVEQTDAKVAYCIDKAALYAFKEFQKTSSGLFANASGAGPSKEAQPLRVASLKEMTHQAEIKAKSEAASDVADKEMNKITEAEGQREPTESEQLEREIEQLEAQVNAMPADADSPAREELETLKAQHAKLQAKK